MRPRMAVLATVAALVLSAPASAQEPPAPLYEAAPAQELGMSTPSDGGRSTVLLSLAAAALAGAGLLTMLAIRRPRAAAPPTTEVMDQTLQPEHVEPPAQPTRRFRIKAPRGAAVETGAAASRGMPVIVEPPEPKCEWRPRVVAEPPLPAFGPDAGSAPPAAPPPPTAR